jgi:competence protein ComEA
VRRRIIEIAFVVTALLFGAGMSIAAEIKPATPGVKAVASGVKAAAERKAARKIKPVDVNSAGKAELMKLRDIGEVEADRIIAGRPYLSKAHLVTRNIIPHGIYEEIKKQIIARQPRDPAARPGRK